MKHEESINHISLNANSILHIEHMLEIAKASSIHLVTPHLDLPIFYQLLSDRKGAEQIYQL